MIKTIELCERTITYEFTVKKVRNINLRIKADGSIHVSANAFTMQKTIENFIRSKEGFILKALAKCEHKEKNPPKEYYTLPRVQELILEICKGVYPYYRKHGVKYPQIKFRSMKSSWGNCRPQKGILTFSTNLRFAPIECIEYVVLHEFTHFLQANHSKEFYLELEKVCPKWKERRKILKGIPIV